MNLEPSINLKAGQISSLVLSILTLVTFTIGILTPPISGSFCPGDCIEYPYLDIAGRFPRDYWWMFTAIFMMMAYVAFAAVLYLLADEKKKASALIGFAFALLSGAVLITNYFIQVSVIQPAALNRETAGIPLLTQYNPHGIFIALEEAGLLLVNVSFLFIAPVFRSADRLGRIICRIFTGCVVVTIMALVIILALHGTEKGYRFEVAITTITWTVMIVNGFLASRYFRNLLKGGYRG
jgi:hypothetical protein